MTRTDATLLAFCHRHASVPEFIDLFTYLTETNGGCYLEKQLGYGGGGQSASLTAVQRMLTAS